MDCDKMTSEMQYVEKNGCCFNIDEKMRLGLAIKELKNDLGLNKVWLMGKITGKLSLMLGRELQGEVTY